MMRFARTDTVAIITGACGGMGQACARSLGAHHRLVLADLDQARLDDFAAALKAEGHDVAATVAGDLGRHGVAGQSVKAARDAGPLRAVVHTAGLSPALAGWEAILEANVIATERLLLALEEGLDPGLTAVLFASIAGHFAPQDAVFDQIMAEPLRQDFLALSEPVLAGRASADDQYGLASPAYGASKRAVIRMAEARAAAWGKSGARIVSLSPGTMWTPMGRKEAENNPAALRVVEATPVGRWGSVLDIASAVEFLISDQAGFITGCDLRIDGGVTPLLAGVTF